MTVRFVTKPFIDKAQDIHLRIISAGNLSFEGDLPKPLFKSGSITRMYPKYRGLRLRVLDPVCILNSDLRFARVGSACLLHCSGRDLTAYPTPPRPTRANLRWFREAISLRLLSMSIRMSCRPTKLSSLRKGTMNNGGIVEMFE